MKRVFLESRNPQGSVEKFSAYDVEANPVDGRYFHVIVKVGTPDYEIPYPPLVAKGSAAEAINEVIEHFRDEAKKRTLHFRTVDLP